MSRLHLWDAMRAPLQEGDDTRYDAFPRAILINGELFYYRVSEHYRDWIEVFSHRGESLGTYRTLRHFTGTLVTAADRPRLPTTDNGRALYRELSPLVGHRIVGIEIMEAEDSLMPFSVLQIDDGREIIIQSDPEGNDGGFPNVTRPGPEGDR